jgi:hypothetical protein
MPMAESIGNTEKSTGSTASQDAISVYVSSLSDECKMLILLKAQLYDGRWEPMRDDLKNRLAGKPYIFKLVNRIQDDIERIEAMMKFEAENGVDLADYVHLV